MNAEDGWSHLPEPLRAQLRELRDKAAARARAALEERRRAFLARRSAEATTFPRPEARSKRGRMEGDAT